MQPVNVFWFRRDLRLADNAGLYQALRQGLPVLPLFIFDRHILDELEEKKDRRVAFIHKTVADIQAQLIHWNSSLQVFHGYPLAVFRQLLQSYSIRGVYANHDYEPYAKERDQQVRQLLTAKGIAFHTFKDQVIFEKNEILKDNGAPYTVFTPYSKRWKALLDDFYLKAYPSEKYFSNFLQQSPQALPSLEALGFVPVDHSFPAQKLDESIVIKYDRLRDFPALNGTTRMSVHLRFGTVSIRRLVARARELNEKYLDELIWRDFYQMILWHFPQVVNQAFKPEYDRISWRNNEKEFHHWCSGQTGYPIVDAGMRELNATGYMHNRLRMITASFLTKHLLIDWRWGEAYFARKLLDFDLAANNGGWQWAAGSGCDAAPYFRIFNPALQTQKFDPDLQYIRQWVPELDTPVYPLPIVSHEMARQRALTVYQKALRN